MNVIYKIGVIIGIAAIYSLITFGLGAIFGHDEDDTCAVMWAWLIGASIFLLLAIFTMEKFGIWM